MKTQTIRLIDVFVIGPWMIYAARDSKNPVTRTGLIVFGIATIIYNAGNYLKKP